jgi:hypothetical protein
LILPWISFQLCQTPSQLNDSAHELATGRNFPDNLEDLRHNLEDRFDHELKMDIGSYLQDLEEQLRVAHGAANKHAIAQGERTNVIGSTAIRLQIRHLLRAVNVSFLKRYTHVKCTPGGLDQPLW